MESFKVAIKSTNILMFDYCHSEYGMRIPETSGFINFQYLRVNAPGYIKRQTNVTAVIINAIYDKTAGNY